MSHINTNMASEFWFFSQLHRLGYEAYITLGNTKAIDVLVVLHNPDRRLTFDVKGKESFQSGSYQYLPTPPYEENYFFVFVGLEVQKQGSRTSFTHHEPLCFIIEGTDLPMIAALWKASTGNAEGFGFYAWLLGYLKSRGTAKCRQKSLASFKSQLCPTGINFAAYQQSILSLDDFEARFHRDKYRLK